MEIGGNTGIVKVGDLIFFGGEHAMDHGYLKVGEVDPFGEVEFSEDVNLRKNTGC